MPRVLTFNISILDPSKTRLDCRHVLLAAGCWGGTLLVNTAVEGARKVHARQCLQSEGVWPESADIGAPGLSSQVSSAS